MKKISYEEKIQEAKYKRIFQALKDIAELEVKTKGKDGKDAKEEVDYAATCSEIKTKARLAIEFVYDLEDDDNDKSRK